MSEREKPRLPQWTLRELAPRALVAVERNKDKDPALAWFATTLVPTAQAFVASYDATHSLQMARPFRAEAQARAVKHVWSRTELWLAMVERDVPSFDKGEYVAEVDSAVRVIAAAERLRAFVTDYPVDQPVLPYAEQLVQDLTQALTGAQEGWERGRSSLAELQASQATTRQHSMVFERELAAFERALLLVLGAHNTDYQALRALKRGKAVRDLELLPTEIHTQANDNETHDVSVTQTRVSNG